MNAHLLYYVTRVDNHHILNVNGKNVSVEVKPATSSSARRCYKYEGVTVYTDYKVHVYDVPFTTVLLAVELVRECVKQEKQCAQSEE